MPNRQHLPNRLPKRQSCGIISLLVINLKFMQNVDDVVKLILVFSVAFTLVGITVQIIRMLNELIRSAKEGNVILKNVSNIVDKFTDDYDYISDQVKMIISGASRLTNNIFTPLGNIFGFLKKFENMFGKKDSKKDRAKDKKTSKTDSKDDDDEDEQDNSEQE
jgi:hypothetical protein